MKSPLKKWRAGLIGSLINLIPAGKPEPGRLRRLDFSANTRKMGFRLTESLRNRWRHRWLKIHKKEK